MDGVLGSRGEQGGANILRVLQARRVSEGYGGLYDARIALYAQRQPRPRLVFHRRRGQILRLYHHGRAMLVGDEHVRAQRGLPGDNLRVFGARNDAVHHPP